MTRLQGTRALAISGMVIALAVLLVVALRNFMVAENVGSFDPGSDSGPVADDHAPRRREGDESAERRALPDASPLAGRAPEPGHLRVGVVGGNGGPWSLLYLPLGTITAAERTRLLIVEATLESLLEERGLILDLEQGSESVYLPERGEGYLLMALSGGFRSRPRELVFEWRAEGAWPDSLDLDLAPVVDIEVLVLDAGGRPAAGVPLIERRNEAGAGALAFVVSDRDGLARFRVPPESAAEDARRERIVEFAGPALDPPSIPFPAAGERAVLRLGPTGSVVFVLKDETGGLLADEVGGTLWAPSQAGRDLASPSWSRRSDQGRLRFDWVGLDLDIGIGARPLDDSREPTSLHFPGPQSAGEEIQLDLQFGPALPRLRGRLVDESGRLLADTSLRIRAAAIPDGADWGFGDVAVTDTNGDFAQTLGWLPADTPFVLEIWVELQGDRPFGADAPRVILRRDNGLSTGWNDVGVVVCGGSLPVAGGRIVDGLGQPRGGLVVELVELDAPADGRRFPAVRPRAVTDADGRFSISAALLGPFRLRIAGREDFLTGSLTSGAIHLELSLESAER